MSILKASVSFFYNRRGGSSIVFNWSVHNRRIHNRKLVISMHGIPALPGRERRKKTKEKERSELHERLLFWEERNSVKRKKGKEGYLCLNLPSVWDPWQYLASSD